MLLRKEQDPFFGNNSLRRLIKKQGDRCKPAAAETPGKHTSTDSGAKTPRRNPSHPWPPATPPPPPVQAIGGLQCDNRSPPPPGAPSSQRERGFQDGRRVPAAPPGAPSTGPRRIQAPARTLLPSRPHPAPRRSRRPRALPGPSSSGPLPPALTCTRTPPLCLYACTRFRKPHVAGQKSRLQGRRRKRKARRERARAGRWRPRAASLELPMSAGTRLGPWGPNMRLGWDFLQPELSKLAFREPSPGLPEEPRRENSRSAHHLSSHGHVTSSVKSLQSCPSLS